MKRIFTLSVIFVVTGLLLPACGTHLTVAKRQHSRGYYVDISSDKKHSGKNTDVKEARAIEQENEMVAEAPKTIKSAKSTPVYVQEEMAEIDETVVTNDAPVTSDSKTASAERKIETPAVPSALQSDKSDAKTVKSTVKDEVKKFSQTSKIKKMQNKQAASGLSLFWIVILILLILWALGLIGGLGWFIHIALVVALILLILWLLGIV